MRTVAMLAAGAALATAGAATAQTTVHGGRGASYPQPGRVVVHGPARPGPAAPMVRQPRWGSKVDGRWWGGVNAPGGYRAYRTPIRGYRLPTYWVAPRFFVTDWRHYGLTQPTGGYNWVRYYDDAVLVDGRGSVYDHRSGVDWDRADAGYDDRAYDAGGVGERRERSGIAGAAAGAVVGGIVGNVIAGRGNRGVGTLLGAGVGAAGGFALDRASDPARRDRARDRRDERGYDGRYGEPPMAPDRGPPPPESYDDYYEEQGSRGDMRGGSGYTSADGRTVVTTTGGGYGASAYGTSGSSVIYAPAGAVTTVTVASAPVITTTTTTTEYYEDAVTYTRAPARRVSAKRVNRAKAKPRCVCR